MADPGEIHQVIMNLFTNAYHAMLKTGGILSVGLDKIMVLQQECLLRTVQELLEELGYAVSPFQNGHQAFEAYAQRPDFFDVVVTDMTMPEMTGLDLSQKILHLRPDQPIILCTGHNELINRQKALDAGISEYFEKPVIINELANIIRKVLKDPKPGLGSNFAHRLFRQPYR